jgi:hypothetical protein
MELRLTETNSADDSPGRAFGLEGNLYLPVVLTSFGAFGLFGILTLLLRANVLLAGGVCALPLAGVVLWAGFLRHGKPSGYDLDFVEQFIGGGSFTRVEADQRKIA